MGINVLSLCDGMSCGQIALKELDIPVDKYYASEIDKVAIKVTMDNFPNTIQLGDVTEITDIILARLPKIDLAIFGSPCRSLSRVTMDRPQYNEGLAGASGLFYCCANILNWIRKCNNPFVKFMVENVDSNKKEDLKIMSKMLGVEPILINSSMFSAQERKRNYWTNITLDPLDSQYSEKCFLKLKDILDENVPEKYYYKQSYQYIEDERGEDFEKRVCGLLDIKGHDIMKRLYSVNYKCPTLTACRGGNKQKKILIGNRPRKLTPNEYRKLQTIPEWYKMDVADSHIYNLCGDGWTIEVIKYLFKNLLKDIKESEAKNE